MITPMIEHMQTDFLIIGSGIAGLYTAIRAAAHGRVTLVTKGKLLDSNTWHAQGGVAAALSSEDSPQSHLIDTLQAGAGLCLEDAVAILVSDGPQRILDLISLGTQFDRNTRGELLLGQEAAHSQRRIVHARGDATGAEIAESLAAYVVRTANLRILENCLALDLLLSGDGCTGAVLFHEGRLLRCHARATVLATGGCGQVYRYTTNPPVATGDGFAMAARAGARLKDMEFVQFHPTALATDENPMPLISEAVRGEGAILVNEAGERFMPAIHAGAELAPRNVVASAIFDQMQNGHRVYLDATHMGERFTTRFPTIFRLCRTHGVDPRTEHIPVAPSAHFIMGGIETDTEGHTNVPGLLACGEVACTGVHGANRLASNSLLEGMGEPNYENYTTQMTKVTDEVASLEIDSWTQNLYWTWLYSLQPIIEVKGNQYPAFMQTNAWTQKDLSTALSSWTELKHDTILYSKQVMAEMGGGESENPPQGYVEPNPEAFARLLALANMTRTGLAERGLLSDTTKGNLDNLIDELGFLLDISQRELNGQAISEEEYWKIQYYGSWLEAITIASADTDSADQGRSYLEDQKSALVADVATGMGRVLEEGVGYPTKIYVVLPDEPYRIGVGAVYTYYEFTVSPDQRMTDESWRSLLESAGAPAQPDWTSSFIIP